MPNIRQKASGKYEAQVRIKGIRESKSFASLSEARKWAYDREHEIRMGHQSHVRGKILADALDRYSKEVTPKKPSATNEHQRIKRLKNNGFVWMSLDDLRPDHIQSFIDSESQRIKASSINRDLNLLSAVLNVARKRWRWIQHNPLEGVDRPKAPLPRERRISDSEIERILAALDYDRTAKHNTLRQCLGAAFLLAIETAMRQGEIYGLSWQHVHLDQKFVHLPKTKNGKPRNVPLSTSAIDLLKRLDPKPTSRVFGFPQASSATIFRWAVQMAGIEDLTFHDTRHEATTRLASKYQLLELAKVTGHSDPRSLMVYYNPTATELAEKLD